MQPIVDSILHPPSATWTHLVIDPVTRTAAVIDPVLDLDFPSGASSPAHVRGLVDRIETHGARLAWILETHAHADHFSAAAWLREETGARIAIGAGIQDVQEHFSHALNLEPGFRTDGSQFDRLLHDGDTIEVGMLHVQVIASPGHTRDSVSYLAGDALFVGDTLFPPDCGTARCDFPGGDAGILYDSIQRLYRLPDATRMFVCHDYPPHGRAPRAHCTVGEQRRANAHVRADTAREAFMALRTARDRSLSPPALLYPAVQVNVRAGALPPPEANGAIYLKVPVGGMSGRAA